VQRLRGAREVQLVRDGDEVPQVPDVHVHSRWLLEQILDTILVGSYARSLVVSAVETHSQRAETGRKPLVLAVVLAGTVLAVLDVAIVNVAMSLPACALLLLIAALLVQRLRVTPFEAQNALIERLPGWAYSMFLMTGGRIGDRLLKDVLSRVAQGGCAAPSRRPTLRASSSRSTSRRWPRIAPGSTTSSARRSRRGTAASRTSPSGCPSSRRRCKRSGAASKWD
jgi:hypothetical protein